MLPTIFLKKYKYILFCLTYSSLLLKHEVKALCKNMNTEWNDCHFWISGEPHTDSCYFWCQSHLHVIKHFSILSHCTSMINTLLQAFTYILVLPWCWNTGVNKSLSFCGCIVNTIRLTRWWYPTNISRFQRNILHFYFLSTDDEIQMVFQISPCSEETTVHATFLKEEAFDYLLFYRIILILSGTVVQLLAQSRVNKEFRLDCSGLYPAGSWKALKTKITEALWAACSSV